MGKVDGRWSVRTEWCGYEAPRWVARFCGRWIGQGATRAEALALRDGHRASFLAAIAAFGA